MLDPTGDNVHVSLGVKAGVAGNEEGGVSGWNGKMGAPEAWKVRFGMKISEKAMCCGTC